MLFCSGGAKEEEDGGGRRDGEEMEVMMVAMGRERDEQAKGVRRQQNYMQAGSCKTKGCMLNSH